MTILRPIAVEPAAPPAAHRLLLSLVVPVLNEQASIQPFLHRIRAALRGVGPDLAVEVLFVNDGSRDGTEFVIRSAMQGDPSIRLVNLSRNFGKEAALWAGLAHARGDAVVPLDVDLQDPPEAIPAMVAKWRAGARIVNARRASRATDGWLKRTTARGFYRVFNWLADQPIPRDVGDFRLLDRQVVDVLRTLGERVRFNKALFTWVGFESEEVLFDRAPRSRGRSAWGWWKLWNLALDGILSSSTKPLRVWSYLGSILSALAFLYAATVLVRTVVWGADTPGYASTVLLILTFGGLNLLAIGILGEYVGRILTEVRERPLYVVRSVHGPS